MKKIAIVITDLSQKWIAEDFNNGIVPLLGKEDPVNNGEDTIYLVNEDDVPNEIILASEFYTDKYSDYEGPYTRKPTSK